CKSLIAEYGKRIAVGPLKAFPRLHDLVNEVSWDYEVHRKVPPIRPRDKHFVSSAQWSVQHVAADRVTESGKCQQCVHCKDDGQSVYYGPKFMARIASHEMHPKDTLDRRPLLKEKAGVGFCNITKCCTEVCPEHIKITDNAIIPLKERMDDVYFDPLRWALR